MFASMRSVMASPFGIPGTQRATGSSVDTTPASAMRSSVVTVNVFVTLPMRTWSCSPMGVFATKSPRPARAV